LVAPGEPLVPRRKSKPSPRFRVGNVTVYEHHGAWWIYYRDAGRTERRKVADHSEQAEQVAAKVNAQLASNEPTLLTFTPIGISELRKQFLDYHEHVLYSAIGTVRRYRSATEHLEDFMRTLSKPLQVHELKAEAFVAYLRRIEVTPNGHKNSQKRRLRTKGVQYILETCRAMYTFAIKRRHLRHTSATRFPNFPSTR
jgi:integrase